MAGLAKSSGLIGSTAATVISAQPTILSGVTLISDGTNPAVVSVYDNASAGSGTILAKLAVLASGGTVDAGINTPIKAENGLTIVVTGTGSPGAIVYYGA